ncbi:MAG: hypothetical protein KatS3mg032_0980 [Cyclobacteriaceae bacterium]|nr:MAG: hypothetical protein KatS3mg032_0980 [Cyclobacteriaceae bacterium]
MENFTPIVFQQARDFSQKLNITFEFIRQNFWPLVKSLLFIAGPVILIGSLLTGSLYAGYLNSITAMRTNPNSFFEFIASVNTWAQGGAAVIFIFISGAAVVSVVYSYMNEYNERRNNQIETDAVWKRVRACFGQMLLSFFLFFLMFIAGYALIVTAVIGVMRLSALLGILLGIAAFIFVIYSIIPLSMVFAVQAFEKAGFAKAAGRCFVLAKGKWWSTFGLIFITSMVQSMMASVFFIPWYANFIVTSLHSLEGPAIQNPSLISQLINNVFIVLYFVASFVLYAIPLIAIAFQYFNLMELKEARGLMSRIESM